MRKMTKEEYDNIRPDDMPPSSLFLRIYGMTFEEVRDGASYEDHRKKECLDKIEEATENDSPLSMKD